MNVTLKILHGFYDTQKNCHCVTLVLKPCLMQSEKNTCQTLLRAENMELCLFFLRLHLYLQ